jgi:acyl carrier protein
MIKANDVINIIQNSDIRVNIEQLDFDELLTEQGLDSLDITTILFSIEEIYQIRVLEDDIEQGKLATINSMIEYVNNKMNS